MIAFGKQNCHNTNWICAAIESRVARIKARVAELTGNMDGPQAPGARPPVPR